MNASYSSPFTPRTQWERAVVRQLPGRVGSDGGDCPPGPSHRPLYLSEFRRQPPARSRTRASQRGDKGGVTHASRPLSLQRPCRHETTAASSLGALTVSLNRRKIPLAFACARQAARGQGGVRVRDQPRRAIYQQRLRAAAPPRRDLPQGDKRIPLRVGRRDLRSLPLRRQHRHAPHTRQASSASAVNR